MLNILKAFFDNPHTPIYVTQLSLSLGKGSGSVSPSLNTLELRGWLISELENIDEKKEGRRKKRFYSLTPKGHADARPLIDAMVKFWSEPVDLSHVTPIP